MYQHLYLRLLFWVELRSRRYLIPINHKNDSFVYLLIFFRKLFCNLDLIRCLTHLFMCCQSKSLRRIFKMFINNKSTNHSRRSLRISYLHEIDIREIFITFTTINRIYNKFIYFYPIQGKYFTIYYLQVIIKRATGSHVTMTIKWQRRLLMCVKQKLSHFNFILLIKVIMIMRNQ